MEVPDAEALLLPGVVMRSPQTGVTPRKLIGCNVLKIMSGTYSGDRKYSTLRTIPHFVYKRQRQNTRTQHKHKSQETNKRTHQSKQTTHTRARTKPNNTTQHTHNKQHTHTHTTTHNTTPQTKTKMRV
jgi:hypothetical protein